MIAPSEAMASAEGARSGPRAAGALASSPPAIDAMHGGFSFADDDDYAVSDDLWAARREAAEAEFNRLRTEKRQAKQRSEKAEREQMRISLRAQIAEREARLGNNTNCVTPSLSDLSIPGFVTPKTGRDFLYFLQNGLRPLQSQRVADCGIKWIGTGYDPDRVADSGGPEIWIVNRPGLETGAPDRVGAHFRGLARCGNIHACPICLVALRARSAEQVTAEVKRWRALHGGDDSVQMLSLTVRHETGDSFRNMQVALGKLFTKLFNGKVAKRIKKKYGLLETCRALDITHGKSGWHPHLHCLLFFEKPLSPTEAAEFWAWLHPRWVRLVGKTLGAKFEPSVAYGVKLTPVHKADYLCAMGLKPESRKDGDRAGMEVVGGAFSKRAKGSNRTPMQIAEDYVLYRRPEDALLWLEYVEAMEGARLLTWSRGLRLSTPTIEEADDDDAVARPLFAPPAEDWKLVRHVRGAHTAILKAVEWGDVSDADRKAAGLAKLAELVAYVLARRARDGSGTDPTRAERVLH